MTLLFVISFIAELYLTHIVFSLAEMAFCRSLKVSDNHIFDRS